MIDANEEDLSFSTRGGINMNIYEFWHLKGVCWKRWGREGDDLKIFEFKPVATISFGSYLDYMY